MSRSYDLALFSGPNRLPLPTNRAVGVQASTGPRGFQDLSGFVPLSDAQADQLATTPGLRAALSDGGAVLWEGRVEDLTLRNGGVEVGALGDSRTLEDVRYTALWSDTSVKGWRVGAATLGGALGGSIPDRFEIDTNNRLYIAPRKGELFGTTAYNSNDAEGTLYYLRPSGSTRTITYLSFDYDVSITSASWQIMLFPLNDDLTLPGGSFFSPGVSGSGTFAGAVTATAGLLLRLRYVAANATFAGETGTCFIRITNLRVKTTTAAPLYADEIVKALRDYVNSVNPGALSTSSRLIVSPGIDLTDEVYEDLTPAEILDRLANYGDASGNKYEWGVYEGRELYFRPAGSAARQWAIDAAELEVEQTLAGLINSTYGLYEDANGRKLRTAAQTSAQSISRYGLTRQGLQEVDTTSGATATTIAATATAATATPVPRARVAARRFSTLGGAPARGEEVRAGDTVTIRNLPPTTNTAIDRLRTFRVAQTRFDLDTGDVEIIPESPTPDLEFQLAFVLKALKR